MTIAEYFKQLPNCIVPEAKDPERPPLFNFRISGDGGGEYNVKIVGTKPVVSPGCSYDYSCDIRTTDALFIDLINKKGNYMLNILSKKINISNLGEFMIYGKPMGLL